MVLVTCGSSQGALNSTDGYRVDLSNLVPYTTPVAAWSDRHSTVTLTWPANDKIGLQTLTSLMGWGGTAITNDLLSWNLVEDGEPLELKLLSRDFRPDKIIETDSADGLSITSTVAAPERNGLAVEIMMTNLRASERTIQLSFDHPGKSIAPDWVNEFPTGKPVSIEGELAGSWSTIYPVHEHGRGVPWVLNFVAGLTGGTTIEMCCISDSSTRMLTLKPNESARVAIPLGFGRNRREAKDAYSACLAKIQKGWVPSSETERLLKLLNDAPRIAARYRGKPEYERLYAHAITGLNGLFVRGDGGYTGYKRIPWTTKYSLAIAFFWDTSFSCTGAREFNPEACKEAIECFTDNATPRGSLPGTLCDTNRAGEGQSPIMAWSAWSIYHRDPDKKWLKRVYPKLAGNIDFWFKYHASPRGLCQFFNAGQVADNDARFDLIQGENAANQNLRGFESPDLNAFLVMEMKCLSEMARVLDLKEDSFMWKEKADRLAELIVETMYFPEDAMFFDVKAGTHEKLSGVKGPAMFLPLWAGVPLPKSEIKRIVEQHMLNPDEFFRERPFPSLSYDDPRHDPNGYWRGRIWPHVVYWMIQTLWRHGYHEEAELTADRLLKMMQSTPWIHENYSSKEDIVPGMPEYNWSLATMIELLLERYKDPLP